MPMQAQESPYTSGKTYMYNGFLRKHAGAQKISQKFTYLLHNPINLPEKSHVQNQLGLLQLRAYLFLSNYF